MAYGKHSATLDAYNRAMGIEVPEPEGKAPEVPEPELVGDHATQPVAKRTRKKKEPVEDVPNNPEVDTEASEG